MITSREIENIRVNHALFCCTERRISPTSFIIHCKTELPILLSMEFQKKYVVTSDCSTCMKDKYIEMLFVLGVYATKPLKQVEMA